MKNTIIALLFAAVSFSPAMASACDLCAIYRGDEAKTSKPGFSLGIFEQFTHFGTLQDSGNKVPNEAGQYMDSSITQIIAGYQFSERFGLQANIPYIHRSFSRQEGLETDNGTVSGIGDMSVTGNLRLYDYVQGDTIFVWSVMAGVKFPTGDSARIAEELDEAPLPPGAIESGIHGHDLALGSGSYDAVAGSSVVYHWRRFFTTAGFQYAIRNGGDFGYHYADDLTWNVKPGGYLYVTDEATLGIQLAATGETKGKDTLMGEDMEDTGITSVFLGPELSYTWHEHLSADIGADFPVLINNTALQIVPDYKLRAAIIYRF